MRSDPTNGQQAAARLHAMALVADGHCAMSEIERLDARAATGPLAPGPWPANLARE